MNRQNSPAKISEKKVLEALLQKSPRTWSELARVTGLSTRTLRKALLRLEKTGVVFRKVMVGEKYPPPVLYGLTPRGREKVTPLLFSLMAREYILGVEVLSSFMKVNKSEEGVEFRFPLKNLYEGLSLEERIYTISRRQLAVQLFALLKAVETGNMEWIEYVPLGLIGDYPLFIQLNLPVDQISAGLLRLQHFLEEKGGEKIMIMEHITPITIQLKEDFARKLRDLLERFFPEELKQIEQIYAETAKFKERETKRS